MARVMAETGSSFHFYFFYHIKHLGGGISGEHCPRKRTSKGTERAGCGDARLLVVPWHLGSWKQKDQDSRSLTTYLECMKPCPKKEREDFANYRMLCTCCSAVRFGRKVQEGIM